MTEDRLDVAVATPLSEELCGLIEQLEPRVRLIRDQDLLPAMRHPADFSGDPSFRRTDEAQARFEAMLDAADALYGIPDVDPGALRRVVGANPRLRWVQVMAAGGGSQVREAGLSADELERVVFTTGAGVHGAPLAEFALFGLLAGAKRLPRLQAQQGRHEWSGRFEMGQLAEQTVLVLGLGGIGKEVARLLKALGSRVVGISRHGTPVPSVDELVHPDRITEVAGRIDMVVAALPGTAATDGMLGQAFFSAVRHGTTVVNVGRGTVIDEQALTAALDDGRVGFAALDVVALEPLAADSALWDHPNVLISPHTAALTAAEDRRLAELFADNASRLIDGRPLRNVVDVVDFY